MSIFLANDTTHHLHLPGSLSLTRLLGEKNIAGRHLFGAHEVNGSQFQAADTLVVNGDWNYLPTHYAESMLTLTAHGISLGKKVWLVNASWSGLYTNPRWSSVLQSASVVTTETISHKEMEKQGVTARLHLHSALDREGIPVPGCASKGLSGRCIVGAFPQHFWVRKSDPIFRGWPAYALDKGSWGLSILKIATAGLCVTGFPTEVYAACLARTPFLFCGNANEICGLIRWSGIEIPVCNRREDLADLILEARNSMESYQQFFSWMEQQTTWGGPFVEMTDGQSKQG